VPERGKKVVITLHVNNKNALDDKVNSSLQTEVGDEGRLRSFERDKQLRVVVVEDRSSIIRTVAQGLSVALSLWRVF
jgi:hypothetical protein